MRRTLLIDVLLRGIFTVTSAVALCLISTAALADGTTVPISTSIKDALRVSHWLGTITVAHLQQQEFYPYSLPGYYRFTTESYCLHAGSYAPTKGAGYLLAPLTGSRAGVIGDIMDRSVRYPDIRQDDIQRLIWAIEAEDSYTSLPETFRAQIAPLLSGDQIASLTHAPERHNLTKQLLQAVGSRLPVPVQVQEALSTYAQVRSVLNNAESTYKDVEHVAVRFGDAPIGQGSVDVNAGQWSFVGSNTYMRVFPSGYQRTDVEIVRSSPFSLSFDPQARPVAFASQGLRLAFTYGDGNSRSIKSIVLPSNYRVRVQRNDLADLSTIREDRAGHVSYPRTLPGQIAAVYQTVAAINDDRNAKQIGNASQSNLRAVTTVGALRAVLKETLRSQAASRVSDQQRDRINELLDLAFVQAACRAAGDCEPNQSASVPYESAAEQRGRATYDFIWSVFQGAKRMFAQRAEAATFVARQQGQSPVQPDNSAPTPLSLGCGLPPGTIVAMPGNTNNQRLGQSRRCLVHGRKPRPPQRPNAGYSSCQDAVTAFKNAQFDALTSYEGKINPVHFTVTKTSSGLYDASADFRLTQTTSVELPVVSWPGETATEQQNVAASIDGLNVHEQGHVTIAEQWQSDNNGIHEAYGNTQAEAVAALQAEEFVVQNILPNREAEYDRHTDHGRNQENGPAFGFPGGSNTTIFSCDP